MIKNIREQIATTNAEALKLAIQMMEVSNEAFIVHTSIPKKLNKATVSIAAVKRPFPLAKFPLIDHAIHGHWDKAKTLENFTQVTQLRHSSTVKLVIHLYCRECLNPSAWQDMEVLKGSRGKVIGGRCNGAEFSIMRGLGISSKEA